MNDECYEGKVVGLAARVPRQIGEMLQDPGLLVIVTRRRANSAPIDSHIWMPSLRLFNGWSARRIPPQGLHPVEVHSYRARVLVYLMVAVCVGIFLIEIVVRHFILQKKHELTGPASRRDCDLRTVYLTRIRRVRIVVLTV